MLRAISSRKTQNSAGSKPLFPILNPAELFLHDSVSRLMSLSATNKCRPYSPLLAGMFDAMNEVRAKRTLRLR